MHHLAITTHLFIVQRLFTVIRVKKNTQEKVHDSYKCFYVLNVKNLTIEKIGHGKMLHKNN
jgi:hypothetical protein